MLLDETCFFLAADFDKAGWREDAVAFVATCRRMDVPCALERSRSGSGAHEWIFFEEALPAAHARKLGSLILTETMERRPDIGFDSYDRFFPNQDTLPKGGLGNLIALPLQKQPRERGNSVFLDDDLNPHTDQWAFLSSVAKIGRARVEDLVRSAERSGNAVSVWFPLAEEDEPEPWATPPSRRRKEPPIAGELPRGLEFVLGNEIYIPAAAIGRIGGGRRKPLGTIDVALIQSLVRKGVVDDRVGEYGHLIVDECHHLSAQSFEQVARRARAKFVTGLSATVTRKDGHHPIIFMQCRPVRYQVNAKAQAALRPFEHTVLRFLADDVAKDWDAVLDAILRVFANRRQAITQKPGGTM